MFPLVELAEVCSVKGGKRLPKGDELVEEITQHPYIRARDIGGGKINFTSPVYITDKTYEKISRYIVSKGDVIITIVGANIGDSAYVEEKFNGANLTENAVKLATNGNMYAKFLKYALTPSYMKGYFQMIASGAAQGKLGLYKIKKVQVPKPPLPTQQKIAHILSAYDDLIENNLKRIKLLEEMAQITYEQWFVRMKFPGHETTPIDAETGLPEGWSKEPFLSLAEFLNGYAFKPDQLGDKGLPIIKIKELKGGVISSTPRNAGEDIPNKYNVQNGDILFSWSGSLEVGLWQYGKGLLNQHLFKVTPNSDVPRSFLYLVLMNSLPFFENLTTGATMKHIKRKELSFVKALVPDNLVLEKFIEIVEPALKTVLNLNKQNQRLIEARDILLPRLMTGMINVDHIELPITKEDREAA